MWTPTPLAPGLLLSPITNAWGPIVSYNLLTTVGPPFSAFAASAAIHRLVPHRGAAFLGWLLYGFSPNVMPQELGHLGMVMAWTPPLVLLLLHELVIWRRWPTCLHRQSLGVGARGPSLLFRSGSPPDPIGKHDTGRAVGWSSRCNSHELKSAAGYRYRMPEGYAIVPGPGDGVAFDPPPSPTSNVLKMIELNDSVPARNEALRRSMACDLVHWQVRTVVVGPMNHEDEAVATMAWVIGQVPEYVQGVWVWWDVSPTCARL